jgi:hypothetical protein
MDLRQKGICDIWGEPHAKNDLATCRNWRPLEDYIASLQASLLETRQKMLAAAESQGICKELAEVMIYAAFAICAANFMEVNCFREPNRED